MRAMSYMWILGGVVWATGVSFGEPRSPESGSHRPSVVLDTFVAGVNGRVVTFGDVLVASQAKERELMRRESGPDLNRKLQDVYRTSCEDLIARALILEEAALKEAAIDERAVDGYMSQTLQTQFKNDRTALLRALAKERMTIKDYRKRLSDDLLVMMLRRQEVDDRVVISPAAVRAEYESRRPSYVHPEQVKLSAILLQRGVTDAEISVKREQAEGVVRRLAAGEDFSTVAREVSEGPGAAGGGEWDWTLTSELVPELREALRSLEAGGSTGVVESGDWMFIARLNARQPETETAFEEVRHDLERLLRMQEGERIYNRWIATLEKRHCVRRMAEPWLQNP